MSEKGKTYVVKVEYITFRVIECGDYTAYKVSYSHLRASETCTYPKPGRL